MEKLLAEIGANLIGTLVDGDQTIYHYLLPNGKVAEFVSKGKH